ncbi:MAG: hypothetical protein E6I33_00700 [Chloroflexi bacterium]|nr:MAG: hypothetical protein E6I33_00700 [Chloroflexota bacterium]
MLRDLGEEPTTAGVAKHYAGIAGTFVIDLVDTALQGAITTLGMQPIVCDTVMADAEDERRLATDIARIVEGWVADGAS